MKVTQPVDVFIADKLFQLASTAAPEQVDEAAYRELLTGKTIVVFGGSLRHRRGHRRARRVLRRQGVRARPLHHRHPRREPGGGRRRAVQGVRRDRPHRLRRQHRGRAAHRQARRDRQRHHRGGAEGQLPGARCRSPAPSYKYLAETKGQLLLYTSSSYTRGRAEYSLYSSTKAAMVNLTQALSDEWAGDGIRVNCVNPERTATPDAHQGLRPGARGHPALLRGRGPHLARRAAVRADRPRHRRPPAGPDGRPPARPPASSRRWPVSWTARTAWHNRAANSRL